MKVKEAAQKATRSAREKTDEMLSEEKFILESLDSPARVAEYLRQVSDGIEAGRIVLTGESGELVLHPGSLVKVALKGKRNSTKSKVSIKLSWSRLDDA